MLLDYVTNKCTTSSGVDIDRVKNLSVEILKKFKAQYFDKYKVELPAACESEDITNNNEKIFNNIKEFVSMLNKYGGKDRLSMQAKRSIALAMSGSKVPISQVTTNILILLIFFLNYFFFCYVDFYSYKD